MKRIISFLITMGLLFLVFQFTLNIFKKSHELTYDIRSNNKDFKVIEKFRKFKDNSIYTFKVQVGDISLNFDTKEDFNKQKKIIKDFEFTLTNDSLCVYPVYIKNNKGNIICNMNHEVKDYEMVKDNSLVKNFIVDLTKKGYKHDSWINTDNKIKLENIYVYNDNLTKDNYIAVWGYRGLYILNKDNNSYKSVLNNDRYENTLGMLINNKYIHPNYDKKYDFDEFLIKDLVTNTMRKLKVKSNISYDSYINGVVDDVLYIFDRKNLKQYSIDPKTEKIRVVGDTDSGAQYYNNKWETRNIYDFVNNEIKFITKDVSEISNKYPAVEYFEYENSYYFYTSNGEFYKVYKDFMNDKVLLFVMNDIKNVMFDKGNIYFIKGNTLYQYSDMKGLKKLVENNEFIYNSNNIYGTYKK